MSWLNFPNPNGSLYIVADSHLDESMAPGDEFVEMLVKLDNPHTIVLLGDLFKIWLAPQKYWTELHYNVLTGLRKLRDRGCNVVFIVGNREMLLPRKLDKRWEKILPFSYLSHGEYYLKWGNKKYGFVHGDTINYNDIKYLRWKLFTHNRLFEAFFKMLPSPFARWIAVRLEKLLSETNKKYKVYFPEKEINEFAESVLDKVDQFFVGHFHIEREIKLKGKSGILAIVPDWLSKRQIFKINNVGEIDVINFEKDKLKNDH